MTKRILYIIALGAIALLSWYFFLRSYHYSVSFKTKHTPGAIYLEFQNGRNKSKVQNEEFLIDRYPTAIRFSEVYENNDSLIEINWEFERVNESISRVSAKFTDHNNYWKQKMIVPFVKNDFVRFSISKAKEQLGILTKHQKQYKISKVTEAQIPERYCACTSVKDATMQTKANKMMFYNKTLVDFFRANDFKIKDFPLLDVTHWDFATEALNFDFCFPVPKQENYKNIGDIVFKTIPAQKALKITFNGNYIISDRSWFSIVEYAAKEGIEISPLPIEFYFNDPHSGENEINWVTEVYMPILE